MTTKSGKAHRIRESASQTIEDSACARVTISLNSKLLKVIDGYADHHDITRSAVFEKALMKWYEALQEEADKDFYSMEMQDPAVRSWSKVSSQNLRYLWND